MRKWLFARRNPLALVIGAFCLMQVLGCGGEGSNFGGATGGNFSAASFNGHYAFFFSGANSQGVLRQSGVLTADGKGNITNGVLDVAQGGGVTSLTFDGTYTVNTNGSGAATLNLPGGHIKLALALVNSTTAYAIENDAFANISGAFEQQYSAALGAAPSGTFVFRLHGLQGPGSAGIVGAFTASNGRLRGDQDVNLAGTSTQQVAITGTLAAPDATGRGTMSMTNAAGATSSFFYYVVNRTAFNILSSNNSGLSGRAERQRAGPYSNASLTGGYVFASTGDDSHGVGASQTVGRFTADGAGAVSGTYDAAVDGSVSSQVNFTGTYAIDAAGRASMNIAGNSGRILRLVSPQRAFFLLDSSSAVEDGTMDLQQAASFSASSLGGHYVLVLGGSDSGGFVERLGLLQADGRSSLTFNGILNHAGHISQPPGVNGNYSVGAGGRVLANVGNLSPKLVLYLISPTRGYALQADPGTEVSGSFRRQ